MTYTEPDTLPDLYAAVIATDLDGSGPVPVASAEVLERDRETYTYLGERSTITKDTRIDPLKAGNETGEVRKGNRVVSARIATAIVDRPGERP